MHIPTEHFASIPVYAFDVRNETAQTLSSFQNSAGSAPSSPALTRRKGSFNDSEQPVSLPGTVNVPEKK